jgi:hypothetical protein
LTKPRELGAAELRFSVVDARSSRIPRRMAWFRLIGGPLLLFGNFGVLFDWWDQSGAVNILVVPEFIWEAFLGIYCAIWGFRKDSPILRPAWRGDATQPSSSMISTSSSTR